MEHSPEMRAGDGDRSIALDRLGQYFADGFLDIDEFEDRTGQAAVANTRGEIDALFADLPEREEAVDEAGQPAKAAEPRAQQELDEVMRRGRRVQQADAVIWTVAMAVFFLGLFVFDWSYFWLAFVGAGILSAVNRSVFQLDEKDEEIFEELDTKEREERAERLRQAAERRRELGQ